MVEGFARSHGDFQPLPVLTKKVEVMETLARHCFDCWRWNVLNVYTTHQEGFVWLTSQLKKKTVNSLKLGCYYTDLGMSLSYKDLLMSSLYLFILQIWQRWIPFSHGHHPPEFRRRSSSPGSQAQHGHLASSLPGLGAFQLRLDAWALKECFLQQQDSVLKITRRKVHFPIQVLCVLILFSLNTFYFP